MSHTTHSYRRQTLPFIVFAGAVLFVALFADTQPARAETIREALREEFEQPPMDYRPHTRWWWMGNVGSHEDITFQLEEMHAKGMGGVEQISMGNVYPKGGTPYLSDKYFEMVKHTVQTAKRLEMNVSLNFGGPGWIIGAPFVPEEDRNKSMTSTFVDVVGPTNFSGPLPTQLREKTQSWETHVTEITERDTLLTVIAGRLDGDRIDPETLTTLTPQVKGRRLEWQAPAGRWRLMAFWLGYSGDGHTVDHFNKAAMERYCDTLGKMYWDAVGEEFGKTVDSFFCDSFEVPLLRGGIYWTTGLMKEFEKRKGYDLLPYLPAVWWDMGEVTPKIRYDVNEFIHQIGLEAFYGPFLEWCEAHGIQGRIQTYGFASDNIQSAGITHIPEMEITAGEKDAVPWFDTRIGPRKYVSSGAHLYGRKVVTNEAYTFIHWGPYRATLEELKIASDINLRMGTTKFYNHGYVFSPERDIAPTRRMGAAVCISHPNVWWEYYPQLTSYLARGCMMLRQGEFVPDVAVYSPLANQWTLNVLNARRWTRDFDWGDLGKLLVGNGYDFDLINDDVIQNHAQIENGAIQVQDLEYKILILPNLIALPLESLRFVQNFVREGGVAVALERLPESSVGLQESEAKDREVQAIVSELFNQPPDNGRAAHKPYGQGHTYSLKWVINRQSVLDWQSSALDPFVNTLRDHVPPSFGIDFAMEGLRENGGLTFMHRKWRDSDLFFVTNVQDQASNLPVTFRVDEAVPWEWDPYTAEISRVHEYSEKENGIQIPLRLAPYESTFIVFEPGTDTTHIEKSTLNAITHASSEKIVGQTGINGLHRITTAGTPNEEHTVQIDGIPAPFVIGGEWALELEGRDFPKLQKRVDELDSWTDDPATRHFSGTGIYTIEFDLPRGYIADDLRLELDLGKVGNIADVELNGKPVGVQWIRGQTFDVTDALRAGQNRLVVRVTNTLINRVSGIKEPPPVPDELVPLYGQGSPAGLSGARGAFGFEPLPPSGLLGPVKIDAQKVVTIAL